MHFQHLLQNIKITTRIKKKMCFIFNYEENNDIIINNTYKYTTLCYKFVTTIYKNLRLKKKLLNRYWKYN